MGLIQAEGGRGEMGAMALSRKFIRGNAGRSKSGTLEAQSQKVTPVHKRGREVYWQS